MFCGFKATRSSVIGGASWLGLARLVEKPMINQWINNCQFHHFSLCVLQYGSFNVCLNPPLASLSWSRSTISLSKLDFTSKVAAGFRLELKFIFSKWKLLTKSQDRYSSCNEAYQLSHPTWMNFTRYLIIPSSMFW